MVVNFSHYTKTVAVQEERGPLRRAADARGSAKVCEIFRFRHPREDFVALPKTDCGDVEREQDLDVLYALASRY